MYVGVRVIVLFETTFSCVNNKEGSDLLLRGDTAKVSVSGLVCDVQKDKIV